MSNPSVIDDIKREFSNGSVINQIILVCIGIFAFQIILKLILFLPFGDHSIYMAVIDWIGIPGDFMEFLYKPWTIFTYMFLHSAGGIFHIIFNMLILFWFGRILVDFIGNRKVLPIFIMGGFAGGAAYLLQQNLIQQLGAHGTMIGASAGVMAIVAATATLQPNYEIRLVFLGSVKIVYIALFLLLMDLMGISNLQNTGGHVGHLGGAFFGFMYMRSLQNGNDWSIGFNKYADKIAAFFQSNKKPHVVHTSKNFKTSYNKKKVSKIKTSDEVDQQKRVDEILDKIKEVGGYDNLTKEEKEFLFKVSRDSKS